MAGPAPPPGGQPRFDPRYQLELVDLPDLPYFRPWYGQCISYWHGAVRHYVSQYSDAERFMWLGDTCFWVQDGESVEACYEYQDMLSVITAEDRPFSMAIKMKPDRNEPDLAVDFLTADAMETVIFIMGQICSHTGIGVETFRLTVGDERHPMQFVNLERPPGWQVVNRRPTGRDVLDPPDGVYPDYPPGKTFPNVEERNTAMIHMEFERLKASLKEQLSGYGAEEFEQCSRDIDMYMEMLEDRDKEIARLRHLRDTIYDDPNVWRACPNCARRHAEERNRPATHTIHSLERQIADAEHLLDHLQHTRTSKADNALLQVSESSQVIHLRQHRRELQHKVQNLRNIIVENPVSYPSKEARVDALARVGRLKGNPEERERNLAAQLVDLERAIADKEKELRLAKLATRNMFEEQLKQLDGLKDQFEAYDRDIVAYLEKVFAGKAYPPGANDRQSPGRLAELTAAAARQQATMVIIPEAEDPEYWHARSEKDLVRITGKYPQYAEEDVTVRSPSRPWLGANLTALSERGAIGQSVSKAVRSGSSVGPSQPQSVASLRSGLL
eukprot:TRINITY_DN17130_c1_g1_i1.p1 TRINITY_DN17130_c1_g1~~TRINITY_DN17130_c1_g1_i1.p1  ORF type:complete len:585 (+),score=189.23 TRINITY_DN17130_c1_g1_i1:83-1756(+)